jgi:hypothetical protein
MNAKYMSAIAVAGVGLILAMQWRSHAESTGNDNENTVQRFGPGVLVMYSAQGSRALKNASIKKVGDRYFVNGTGFLTKAQSDDEKYRWFSGTDLSCALSEVSSFSVLTDAQWEEYEKAPAEDE